LSLFTPDDYRRENLQSRPSNGRVSKKTKLPTIFKTKPHNCSQCPRTDAKKYPVSGKEFRWLCPACLIKNNNRDKIEKPNFIRASKLQVTH